MARENFPLNMQEELQSLGLDITQVPPGRYVEIDLGVDRREKEMFAEYGSFDTFTVLNSRELKGLDIFIYLNTPSPVGRYPLELIKGITTIADRFYLEHRPYPDVKLKLILGGDLRALQVNPTDQGSTNIDGSVSVDNMPLVQINAIIQEMEEIRGSINDKNNNDVVGAIEDVLSKLAILDSMEQTSSDTLNTITNDVIPAIGYIVESLLPLTSINTKLSQLVSIKSVLDDVSSKLNTLTTMDSKLGELETNVEEIYNLLNSSPKELAGATLAERPTADSVPAGSTFTLVQSPIVIYMSDGSAWVELS